MSNLAYDVDVDLGRPEGQARMADARPVPRITIQAFCDTPEVAGAIEMAANDRRMGRAHVKVHTGGISAAVEFYRGAPTPNLVVIESRMPPERLIAELDTLAEVCDAGTRVMIIGHSNDVTLYRELLKRGISEYLVAPVDVMTVISSISNIYRESSAEKLGQAYAFVGSKGGVGASTVAHNVAWTMARVFGSDVILADLDLAFGTAGLDFNLDPTQGIAEAVFDRDRLDEVLLDRLLAKCEDHLSLLAAPATLDRSYDFDEGAFEPMLEIVQANVPSVVLDVPHVWTSWAKRTLISADEVVIVAAPDLANLRNTKALIDLLRQARPNDAPPKLVLNQVGVPKRPEIKPDDFAAALQLEPIASIPFDPLLFGTAANNGQMIAEASAKTTVSDIFSDVAQIITGRKDVKRSRKGAMSLAPLLEKLRAKQKPKAKARRTA
ncbi:AAA family ATPase [Propylenella binzhouense]|uniref:CtpF protein n=1 Tax=Propylenella binzhouense TaxID=2555902 RepID=A0A964T536_9HYPH|nr:AAA family ATPase [Propylenella binzhouense]MYZ48671.1 CtpF protein [Propylenella binzhouense]